MGLATHPYYPHQESRVISGNGCLLRCLQKEMHISRGASLHNPFGSLADPALVNTPTFGLSEHGRNLNFASGSSEHLTLSTTAFDNVVEGEIAMLVKYGTQAASTRYFVATNNAASLSLLHFSHNDATLALTTHNGTAGETISQASSGIGNNEWHVVGCSWGPDGKSLYVDGVQVKATASQTGGVGSSTDAPTVMRGGNTVYTDADLAWLLVFDKQYGKAFHDKWNREWRVAA